KYQSQRQRRLIRDLWLTRAAGRNFCLTVSAGERTLAAIATTIPTAGLRLPEPLAKRLASALARWHDRVFGPANKDDLYSLLFSRAAGVGALALILEIGRAHV